MELATGAQAERRGDAGPVGALLGGRHALAAFLSINRLPLTEP
jgi:hypothetical protein